MGPGTDWGKKSKNGFDNFPTGMKLAFSHISFSPPFYGKFGPIHSSIRRLFKKHLKNMFNLEFYARTFTFLGESTEYCSQNNY